MLRHVGMKSSALASKNRNNNRREKRKFKITLEVLNEVTPKFAATKKVIEERLQQKCLKENISVDDVIFLFTKSKELVPKNIFNFLVLDFQPETF